MAFLLTSTLLAGLAAAQSVGEAPSAPNATVCPDVETCQENCIMEGVSDYEAYGIFTDGGALTLKHLREDGSVSSPRVYLLNEAEDEYEMIKLTGQEFTFDVDGSKLPCGMNGALYMSEMAADGGLSELNTGGAAYGTGYCDAQCFTTPFINGVCTGDECAFDGVCDKNGCGYNPYRVHQFEYYGPGYTVDTARPVTVVTQFPADDEGKLKEIRRLYVQDGRIIKNAVIAVEGLPEYNYVTDEFCAATGSDRFMDLGALGGMGDAMTRGMVLCMSIWWDEGGHMTWLDSEEAGPCKEGEGDPKNILEVEANPTVIFSNIKWGEIGSTYKPECKKKSKRSSKRIPSGDI
ncbi:unnamed protein product [Parascedosporium putredinis]|uniref:Glucanase n=1 Tax=Parascedosporium putredinis TaxID=1442378 RepID=A0A9P1H7P2_9PEZI|nr:unnamed protein product [Parascedosporium putredinis]CAI7999908.1 unnamed protein product [Parascedosporium putredinis]